MTASYSLFIKRSAEKELRGLPKADLSKVTNDDIYAIQERLNNRPRKSLNYLTPNEVTAKFIKSGAVKP